LITAIFSAKLSKQRLPFYRISNGFPAKTTLQMTWQRGIPKVVDEVLKKCWYNKPVLSK